MKWAMILGGRVALCRTRRPHFTESRVPEPLWQQPARFGWTTVQPGESRAAAGRGPGLARGPARADRLGFTGGQADRLGFTGELGVRRRAAPRLLTAARPAGHPQES